jgi:hypothetical protein
VQSVFRANTFLWGFVVAWGKSGKTRDERFVESQWRVMKTFNGRAAMAGSSKIAMAGTLRLAGALVALSTASKSAGGLAAAPTHLQLAAAIASTSGVGQAGTSRLAVALVTLSAVLTALKSAGALAPTSAALTCWQLAVAIALTSGAGQVSTMAAASPLMLAVGELRMAAAAAKGTAAAKSMAVAMAKGTAPLPRRRVTAVGPLPRQPPGAHPLESRVSRVEMSSSKEEDDDKGEMETTDTDSNANAAMEEKRKHVEMVGNKSHAPMPRGVPQHSSQRTMPCSRCARLRHDCYEQVNGICMCYHCDKAKVHCMTGDVGEVARSRRSRVLAKTTVKNSPTSRKKTSLARQFTQAKKGKSKGEYYFSSYIETFIHQPIATDFDIGMADPKPVLPAAATPIPDLD